MTRQASIDFGPHFVALAAPSGGGGTRVASRATRGVRYGEGYSRAYDRAYDGGSRGYAREAYNSARGGSYSYDRADSGSQYRSGYATIYR